MKHECAAFRWTVGWTALVLASCLPLRAAAIVSKPEPRICNEFAAADYVFVGEVLDHGYADKVMQQGDRDPDPEGFYLSQTYRVQILEQFKGELAEEAAIYTSNDSGGGVLDAGRRNIVFARQREGRPHIGGGGNTAAGPEALAIITALREYLAHPTDASTASVRGRIVTYGSGTHQYLHAAAYIQVAIEGGDGTPALSVRSDPDGWFEFEVAPGKWRVHVVEPGWAGRPWDFSYDNPDNIVLEAGGCADVQLLATPENRESQR